jgi:hypothetical protein
LRTTPEQVFSAGFANDDNGIFDSTERRKRRGQFTFFRLRQP